MRSGQAAPIPLGGNLSRSMMSTSPPALPSTLLDQFYDTMEITNPPTVQVESVRREPGADALHGPEEYEHIMLRNGISGIALGVRKLSGNCCFAGRNFN